MTDMALYRSIIRPVVFSLDSEAAHKVAMQCARVGQRWPFEPFLRSLFRFDDERLCSECFGLQFDSPVGLAAGFDKDCEAPLFFWLLGFSCVEVGTITAEKQPGNPRPRIFRLPSDKALINRMGFPSGGAEEIAPRIERLQKLQGRHVLGVNIGKTKVAPIDDALEDYLKTFHRVHEFADYIAINVSSPNTPELRMLQERERLLLLMKGLQQSNTLRKPLLVKVAPDLSLEELNEILLCCEECGVAGIIATNTTFSREGLGSSVDQTGGLSGSPLLKRSKEMVAHIYRETNGKLPVVGVGGISSAEDVLEFMKAGASLVQLYTSLVYEGPFLVKKIKQNLVRLFEREGIRSPMEVVGAEAQIS